MVKEIGFQRKIMDALDSRRKQIDANEPVLAVGDRNFTYEVTYNNETESRAIIVDDPKAYQLLSPKCKTWGQLKPWPIEYQLPKFDEDLEIKMTNGVLSFQDSKRVVDFLFKDLKGYFE